VRKYRIFRIDNPVQTSTKMDLKKQHFNNGAKTVTMSAPYF